MKKTYIEPSVLVSSIGMATIICASQDISSSVGITYGGVDETGKRTPASRRSYYLWEEEF